MVDIFRPVTIQGFRLDFEVLLIVDWTLMLESFSLGLYHGFFKLSECRCQCTETWTVQSIVTCAYSKNTDARLYSLCIKGTRPEKETRFGVPHLYWLNFTQPSEDIGTETIYTICIFMPSNMAKTLYMARVKICPHGTCEPLIEVSLSIWRTAGRTSSRHKDEMLNRRSTAEYADNVLLDTWE